jgi:hypothetical protein
VREHAAPRIRGEVGRETVDVFGAEQAAAFLNGLNWHPRPVFQAYAAFTPALSQRNARFLAGDAAPRYVLLRVATIDQRLPGMDDASSLAVLARDYEAVLEENGFLLFRRRADAPRLPAETQLVRRAQIAYGERLELEEGPGGALRLELELPARPADALRSLVWKAEPVWIELALSDGRTVVHRILPEMLCAGVLLEPWLEDHDAWIHWLAAGERVSVRALRVLPPAAGRPGGAITARILVAPGLAPAVVADRRAALLWPMFDRAPTRITGARPAARRLLRNRIDVLTVFAPSELEFELGAGRWRLEAGYGILPAALLNEPGDGVRFEIRLAGAEPLLGRVLDPAAHPGRRRAAGLHDRARAARAGAPDPGDGSARQSDLGLGLLVDVAMRGQAVSTVPARTGVRYQARSRSIRAAGGPPAARILRDRAWYRTPVLAGRFRPRLSAEPARSRSRRWRRRARRPGGPGSISKASSAALGTSMSSSSSSSERSSRRASGSTKRSKTTRDALPAADTRRRNTAPSVEPGPSASRWKP